MKVKYICCECGKEFKNEKKHMTYCSRSCALKAYNRGRRKKEKVL